MELKESCSHESILKRMDSCSHKWITDEVIYWFSWQKHPATLWKHCVKCGRNFWEYLTEREYQQIKKTGIKVVFGNKWE